MLIGCSAGKRISEEEGGKPLMPSSTMLRVRLAAEGCVDIVVRLFLVTSTPGMLWRFLFQMLLTSA